MKPPRITIRRLMVAIAMIGVLVGAETMRRRRAAFVDRSVILRYSEWLEGRTYRRPGFAEHYGRLAEKYERAARYPWLPVAPDPPGPE